jgi:protein-disulfide isomerase
MTRRTMLACALALAVAPVAPAAEKPPAPPRPGVVALLGAESIDASEVDAAGGARLFTLHTQEYDLRKQILDGIIAKRLLEKEAKARGITADELTKLEVDNKVPEVSEAEAKVVYDQNNLRAKNPDLAEADALKQIVIMQRNERRGARRAEFVAGLRKAAGVKVLLDPPRVKVTTAGGPAKGPESAPVTIVEYADYQCPYCGRALPTVKQIDERYAGKIRHIYRDFPLTSIHPNAGKAAEAGQCANDQGKFWPMRDRLFADPSKLGVDDLKKHASELGLDTAVFAACLDSGKHIATWQKSLEEGQGYGLNSTPSFFVNGRLIVGARPFESFAQVIDDELDRAASTGAQSAAAPKKSEQ